MRHHFLTAVLTAFVACIGSLQVRADTLIEDFNAGILPERWTVSQTPAVGAPWIIEAPASTDGIRISKPADADFATTWPNVSIQSQFTLDGDLSVWVDFDLHSFPLSDIGGWNEIGLMVSGFSVLRFSTTYGQFVEGYSYTTGLPFGEANDNTTTGKLGVSRQGTTMGAWIDRGSGPVLIGSLTDSAFAGPTTMLLFVSQAPGGTRPHTALDVRFDNVSITADSIVPEPTTLSLLMLGGLAFTRIRRR